MMNFKNLKNHVFDIPDSNLDTGLKIREIEFLVDGEIVDRWIKVPWYRRILNFLFGGWLIKEKRYRRIVELSDPITFDSIAINNPGHENNQWMKLEKAGTKIEKAEEE